MSAAAPKGKNADEDEPVHEFGPPAPTCMSHRERNGFGALEGSP